MSEDIDRIEELKEIVRINRINRKRKRKRHDVIENIVQSVASNLFDENVSGHLPQNQEDWEKQSLVHLKAQWSDDIDQLSEVPELPELWCLTVVTAQPDYKRPYSETSVFHFETEEDARKRARKAKIDYYIDWGMLEDEEDAENITDTRLEELEDKSYDHVYGDSYMDMSPVDTTVCKVKIQ